MATPRTGRPRERAPFPASPRHPATGPGIPGDPLLTIDEVTTELRVSRAAFYRWRRQGTGPAVVRLPGGSVRVQRSALTTWLRRLEEERKNRRQEHMDSYDVRFWDIKRIGDTSTGGRYRARWAVDGREHCKSFRNKTLAGGFLDGLKNAVRDRRPSTRAPACPRLRSPGTSR